MLQINWADVYIVHAVQIEEKDLWTQKIFLVIVHNSEMEKLCITMGQIHLESEEKKIMINSAPAVLFLITWV